MIEPIEWIGVDRLLPDDDLVVLIAVNYGLNEPVWLGYHSDGRWFTADSLQIKPGGVSHWAEMPVGPNLLSEVEE